MKGKTSMCGIIGGNNLNWNYNEAISLLSHRGPNGHKIQRVKNIFLGFARLAKMENMQLYLTARFMTIKG